MSCSSASVGFCPSDLITVPSSLVVIVPSPSLSNKENASLNSAICSKLLGGDCAIAILVEQGECLFELSDLFLSQLVSHFWILISQSLRGPQETVAGGEHQPGPTVDQ